jgi:hypothetical protein
MFLYIVQNLFLSESMNSSNEDFHEDVWEYYDKIKEALDGLFKVLNIALDPNSVYYQCGVDNLKALKGGLIELLMKDYDTLDLQDTLRKIEFDVKKSLFFNDPKKRLQKNQDEEKAI